jgi:PKD repeat protein
VSSLLQNPPPITFQNPGRYIVSLTVQNSAGSNTSSKTVIVRALTPVASFTYTKTSSRVVYFQSTSTNSPTSCLWTFGDGTSSSIKSPRKVYRSAGSFTVRLKTSNSVGFNTKSSTIIVT